MKFPIFIISIFITFILTASPTELFNQVQGKIINTEHNEAIDSAFVSLHLEGEEITSIWTDKEGNFSFEKLALDKRYRIIITKENYALRTKLIFTTKNTSKLHTVTIKLIAVPEFEVVNSEKRLIINRIDFIPDSYELTKEAKDELIRIRKILKKYPYMKIEVGFHTGSRGDANFLKELSQKRADICRDFLIEGGLDASNISSRGYGNTQLLNDCDKTRKCSNKQHLVNKRSVFLVK